MVEIREKTWTDIELRDIIRQAKQEIQVEDRSYHFKTYNKCFVARDMTTWLVNKGHAADRAEAVRLGKALVENLLIVHVVRDHDFKDQYLFFKFICDARDLGHVRKDEEGNPTKSWRMFLANQENVERDIAPEELKNMLIGVSDMAAQDGELPHVMLDPINCEMYDNVRPLDWVAPELLNEQTDYKVYDMVAIGGGAAGMVTCGATTFLGGTALMIEKAFLGGDCLVSGCVPSKAFLKSAKVAHQLRHNADEFGLEIQGQVKVNFGKVMERMRKIRTEISVHDSAENFSKTHGIDIMLGAAKFVDRNTVEVNGKRVKFFKATICSGGRPRISDVPGLGDIPHYTSENVWNMTKQPEKLLIIGAGPIACELGQGFQRLGTEVTMLARGSQFLPREDQDAAEVLKAQLKQDGCNLQFNAKPVNFELMRPASEHNGHPEIKVTIDRNGQVAEQSFNAVLFAIGRVPNVEGLGLEQANVSYSVEDGVQVNRKLQTSNPNIYAAGDCCTKLQFTHHSDVMARTVVYNAILMKGLDINKVALPWCTFTDPEIATVGKTEQQLQAENIRYTVYKRNFAEVDRAICDSATNGFVKVLTKEGKADILGATFVGGPAGDMISQITMGMSNGLKLQQTGSGVSPYPSYADAVKNLTDQFNRTKLTNFVKGLLSTIVKLRR